MVFMLMLKTTTMQVTPRGHAVLLEHVKKHAYRLHTDAQDYACHANRK